MLGGLFQQEALFFTIPAVHELAEQAGIELPQVLGRLNDIGQDGLCRVEARQGAEDGPADHDRR